MRHLILAIAILTGTNTLLAQSLTGKWKGYFTPNNEQMGRVFSYEIEITEQTNHQLNIVTLTKLSNDFTAKAIATGLFTPKSQLISINEIRFEDLQIKGTAEACLMSNFLTYANIRGHEIMNGTYLSNNPITQKDCGGGTIYLEKVVPISYSKKAIAPIHKNEAIAKKNQLAKSNQKNISETNTIAKPIDQTAPVNHLVKSTPVTKNTTPINSSKIQHIEINLAAANTAADEVSVEESIQQPTVNNVQFDETKLSINNQKIPWVLVGRENKLVKKITTTSNKFSIDLYDNGTIDNDTIIIYDNNQLIVNKKRLSYKSIHVDFDFTNNITEHEVIIVAHNMGSVPPNTALLVLKDGIIRQEFFITSTNKMNAKLVIAYSPPDKR